MSVSSFLAKPISRAAARRPWLVLAVAAIVTVVAVLCASRIQIKTAFQDTMADDDPIVVRMRYLSENFPGAIVVQVVLEGGSPERLIEAAEALRDGFLDDKAKAGDDDLVSQVYLEADLDFFLRHAFLYLPERELRLLDEKLRRSQTAIKTLTSDPSLLGLLRSVEQLTNDNVPQGNTAVTLRTRLFADVVMSRLLSPRPSVDVGAKVDPGPLQRKLKEKADEDLVKSLKGLPLPPSDEEARRTLIALEGALDLAADVIEQGDSVAVDFERRAAALLDVAPASGGESAIPARYQFSPDKKLLVMDVGSNKDLGKLEDIRPVLAHLFAVGDDVRQRYPDVDIGFTGLPVQYAQEQDAILSNFLLVTLLGFLAILALFVVGFEQVALPSLSVVPLLMGITWTFGVQGIVDPTLNMLNLLFPVVIFGIGIDAGIYLLNGFAHRRALGDEPEDAVRHMLEEILPGILTGAVTTAAAFYALMIAHMKGLKALGFTAGTGILVAIFAMVVVLPAIFVLYDRVSPVKAMQEEQDGSGWLRFGAFVEKRRYLILAVTIGLVSLGIYHAPKVSLERDALKMQPKGMPAAVLQEKLLKAFAISGEPSIFFAKDLDEARKIVDGARRARTLSAPLAITLAIPDGQADKGPLLDAINVTLTESIESAAIASPPTHRYDEAELDELRTRLARVKALLLEVSALSAVLYHQETQDKVGALRDHVNRIERGLANAQADRLMLLDTLLSRTVKNSTALAFDMAKNKSVTFESLPDSLRSRVAGKDGATMVLVRANGYIGDEVFLEAHVKELYAIHAEVAGIVPAWREMLRQILVDVPRLLAVIAVSILVLVFLGLHSIKGTFLSLSPLAVALALVLGFLGATGNDLNFVSVLSLPLLLGTGIDYGIHLYERIHHEHNIGKALAHSGKALVLSASTTMIGFASLMLSVHRGVFGLGFVMAIGIVCSLAIALFVLPAVVAIFQPEILRGPPPSPPVAPPLIPADSEPPTDASSVMAEPA